MKDDIFKNGQAMERQVDAAKTALLRLRALGCIPDRILCDALLPRPHITLRRLPEKLFDHLQATGTATRNGRTLCSAIIDGCEVAWFAE